MTDFAKGVKVKSVKTKYGEILKVGINLEEFANNIVNERGYINFDILRAKETGNPYAAIDNYKREEKTESQDEIIQFADDENIPF